MVKPHTKPAMRGFAMGLIEPQAGGDKLCSQTQAAARVNVSQGTVSKWKKVFSEEGRLERDCCLRMSIDE